MQWIYWFALSSFFYVALQNEETASQKRFLFEDRIKFSLRNILVHVNKKPLQILQC